MLLLLCFVYVSPWQQTSHVFWPCQGIDLIQHLSIFWLPNLTRTAASHPVLQRLPSLPPPSLRGNQPDFNKSTFWVTTLSTRLVLVKILFNVQQLTFSKIWNCPKSHPHMLGQLSAILPNLTPQFGWLLIVAIAVCIRHSQATNQENSMSSVSLN